jgi:hypothetical protein
MIGKSIYPPTLTLAQAIMLFASHSVGQPWIARLRVRNPKWELPPSSSRI